MTIESMSGIYSGSKKNVDKVRRPDNVKKIKDVQTRVTEEALRLLRTNNDLSPELLERAAALIESSDFMSRIKSSWDNDTARGAIHEDPAEQDKLWAQELIREVKHELAA